MRNDTQENPYKTKKKRTRNRIKLPKHLEHINKMAAGIDIGSKSHFVAVPAGGAFRPNEQICILRAYLVAGAK